MTPALPPALESALSAWFDDDDSAALEHACELARTQVRDIDALLTWVRDYGGSAAATALAQRRLRFALGLPVIAGPVCRRPTSD